MSSQESPADRGAILRFLWIGLAMWLAWTYLPKLFGGGHSGDKPPIGPGITETDVRALRDTPPEKCKIRGQRYEAELSARDAALVMFWTTGDPRYQEAGQAMNLTTVPASAPDRFALGFDFRALGTSGDDAQVANDVADWTLGAHDDSSCTFTWTDERVAITKTFRASTRPYELDVEATIENLSDAPRKHRLGVENTAWRTAKEVDSKLGRQSPFMTDVGCAVGGKLTRYSISDFSEKDFAKPEFDHGFRITPGPIDFAATTSAYFAQAIVPVEAPAPPACATQIEERWFRDRFADKKDDPDAGAMYRSRLVYPQKSLAPHEKARYAVAAYFGPKDRVLLAHAVGGDHHLDELINMGSFAVIGKVMIAFLVKAYGVVGSWGISIVLLTLFVRLVLLPLTWKQIQSMVAMRRLKPEIDALNRTYAHDAQAKNVATMEMYRKNGVNPFGGCLPVLVQMPVWWAMYSTIQSAVELYHTPFLYFTDLSAPDPFFVLPIVIGLTSFVQQKLMPQQMDAQQQKMMLYFFPLLFTFMMLFLPSGLGVYMLTNSVLGIVQQQIVERFLPGGGGKGGIRVTSVSDAP